MFQKTWDEDKLKLKSQTQNSGGSVNAIEG